MAIPHIGARKTVTEERRLVLCTHAVARFLHQTAVTTQERIERSTGQSRGKAIEAGMAPGKIPKESKVRIAQAGLSERGGERGAVAAEHGLARIEVDGRDRRHDLQSESVGIRLIYEKHTQV